MKSKIIIILFLIMSVFLNIYFLSSLKGDILPTPVTKKIKQDTLDFPTNKENIIVNKKVEGIAKEKLRKYIKKIENKYGRDFFSYTKDLLKYVSDNALFEMSNKTIQSISLELEGERKEDYEHTGDFLYLVYDFIGLNLQPKNQCIEKLSSSLELEEEVFGFKNILYSNFIKSSYFLNGNRHIIPTKIGHAISFSNIKNFERIEDLSIILECQNRSEAKQESCNRLKKDISSGNKERILEDLVKNKKENHILYEYLKYKVDGITKKDFINNICF